MDSAEGEPWPPNHIVKTKSDCERSTHKDKEVGGAKCSGSLQPFFSLFFCYHIIVVLELHCDIYKRSYNIS
jgi:hypothetical protein